jgi:hypothetical protein
LLLAAPLAIPFASHARSATLMVGETALQKLLDTKFPSGKIPIGDQNDCNNPYIERVRIKIDQDRVHVAGHLAGRVGKKLPVLGCVSAGDPSDFSVSGAPVASGSILKLSGINLDSIEKSELKAAIGYLLTNFVGDAVQIDLKPAVQSALKGSAPYQLTLDDLLLQTITAQKGMLTVDFDIKLSVQ